MQEAGWEVEVDQGRRHIGAAAERLCIATRTVRSIDEMIRFVAGPDGIVVPDLKRRLPGRGVWVTATRSLVAQAVRRDAFSRALKRGANAGSKRGSSTSDPKTPITAPPDLPDLVDSLLVASALEALAMTRKAGLAITGFAKVEAAITGEIAALIRADDAGEDSGRKLVAALRGRAEKVPLIEVFTSAQLDLAFGRPNVVHAALFAGRPSETFLQRWRILDIYRADAPVGRRTLPVDAKTAVTKAPEPGP